MVVNTSPEYIDRSIFVTVPPSREASSLSFGLETNAEASKPLFLSIRPLHLHSLKEFSQNSIQCYDYGDYSSVCGPRIWDVGMGERSFSTREVDPLLKDLAEKKQNFRHCVISLAAEIKDVRGQLALKQQSLAQETLNRQACNFLDFYSLQIRSSLFLAKDNFHLGQAAEAKVKCMEDVISQLQRSLEEKNRQLLMSKSNANQYLKELDNLGSQISVAQALAGKHTTSTKSAQLLCVEMLRELDKKKSSLEEHDVRFNILGQLLDHLIMDLEAMEASQEKLKDEIFRIERDIIVAVSKAGYKDEQLRKILEEITHKDFECIKKHLAAKDEEIARLKDEVGVMTANCKFQMKEFESQLEKYERSDQELKKRVLKLEFCQQEARSQIQKLQRTGEKRDKALKELRDQLAMKQQMECSSKLKNFWESSGFKIGFSLSILVLVLFAKR
ncbi:hypothetical protein ACLOJK_022031 [Asimina triloba]